MHKYSQEYTLPSSPTLLIAHEGKSGSFIRWLNELGLGDFLNRYPLSQLVEWGWVVPKYRVTFPQQFFERWTDYPNSPWDCPDLIASYTQIGGNHLGNKSDEIKTKSLRRELQAASR